jgi:predicted esterase
MPSNLRVQFAHGLESSPQGIKARRFAEHFVAETPAMNTLDFESCVAVHAATLERFRPDVLVGSSFGGAVVVALLERGLWRGPTLLLAQAAENYRPGARLPEGVRVLLVHARQDAVVPVEHSRALAKTGTPALVELIECDDDHPLTALVESGELIELVRRVAELS